MAPATGGGGAATLDAAALVGLLADDDRRAVFAAITLGATGRDDVARRSGLPVERASKALTRLVDGGLVVGGEDGSFHVLGVAFARAAREALARPRSTEHDGHPPAVRKVLDAFVRGGRLVSIPTSHAKRMVVLDWLAQSFEPGERYAERRVNAMLERRHPDPATLRRLLVDEEFLARDRGTYWRTGGTVG